MTPFPVPSPRHGSRARAFPALGALALTVLTGCGSGGGGSSEQVGLTGATLEKPDGSGPYFVDPHRSGQAERLGLVEVSWGRLVDVHDVQADGSTDPDPIHRDLVVRESVLTNATGYRLERNPVTAKTRLVIRRTRGEPDTGSGTFEDLLRLAKAPLAGIDARDVTGSPVLPHPLVPRNACIVLQFDDLLADDLDARRTLEQMVTVTTGYPPLAPHAARVVFDPNHGGEVAGTFHSTRVLVDLSVSAAEASTMVVPVEVNPIGLVASRVGTTQANVALHLPLEESATTGQFAVLRTLGGKPLAPTGNGPRTELPIPALERAFRSGNSQDGNNGFLVDIDQPRILAQWPATVLAARDVPEEPGFQFDVDLGFATVCREQPLRGDSLLVGSEFFEVLEDAAIDREGVARDVRIRTLSLSAVDRIDALGQATFSTPFRSSSIVEPACWVTFSPPPAIYPNRKVAPFSQISIRLSEPMDPATVSAANSLQVIAGPIGVPTTAQTLLVGEVVTAQDLLSSVFVPRLPFAHLGEGALFHLRTVSDNDATPSVGMTDLAGNVLEGELPPIEFEIDEDAPRYQNAGVTQRFNSPDELPRFNRADVRGNVFVNDDRGVLEPRRVSRNMWPADSSNPVPSVMIGFPPGIQTPLTPLGSKLQTLWRYADLGWQIRDESKYDLDVVGLHWVPVTNFVSADFYPEFEMRLSHASRIPDERRTPFGPSAFPNSGLGGSNVLFTENILDDPRSPQLVVHPRELGYRVEPTEIGVSPSGAGIMPWPFNRDGNAPAIFTWRDTSVLGRAGDGGAGVPLSIEADPPLEIEPSIGDFARAGRVPSVGLPLLMEFRCYPTSSGLGLNPLNILLAINTSAQPNFRAFSTGGINTSGRTVTKNPDLELFPTGGFNPGSSPPGAPTMFQADNSFYQGALETVTRISRGHSMWIDTQFSSPFYVSPIVLPSNEDQPAGTSMLLEFRGADSFVADPVQSPFNAAGCDAYGNLRWGVETFHLGRAEWSEEIEAIDGARYFQMRYTFFANVEAGITAEIDTISVAYGQE